MVDWCLAQAATANSFFALTTTRAAIREWQNVCINKGSRWGHLTLRSSLYRFCRCLKYFNPCTIRDYSRSAKKKNTFEQRLHEGARREERLFTGEICTLPPMSELFPFVIFRLSFLLRLVSLAKSTHRVKGYVSNDSRIRKAQGNAWGRKSGPNRRLHNAWQFELFFKFSGDFSVVFDFAGNFLLNFTDSGDNSG